MGEARSPFGAAQQTAPDQLRGAIVLFLRAVHCNASFPSNALISVCKKTKGMLSGNAVCFSFAFVRAIAQIKGIGVL